MNGPLDSLAWHPVPTATLHAVRSGSLTPMDDATLRTAGLVTENGRPADEASALLLDTVRSYQASLAVRALGDGTVAEAVVRVNASTSVVARLHPDGNAHVAALVTDWVPDLVRRLVGLRPAATATGEVDVPLAAVVDAVTAGTASTGWDALDAMAPADRRLWTVAVEGRSFNVFAAVLDLGAGGLWWTREPEGTSLTGTGPRELWSWLCSLPAVMLADLSEESLRLAGAQP